MQASARPVYSILLSLAFYMRRETVTRPMEVRLDVGTKSRSPEDSNRRERVFPPVACAAPYRRSMLEEFGLFDEDFFSNCEDVDIGFRARLAGYVCLYWPQAIVYHHGSGTTGIGNARVEFLTSRNFEYVFFKNVPLP